VLGGSLSAAHVKAKRITATGGQARLMSVSLCRQHQKNNLHLYFLVCPDFLHERLMGFQRNARTSFFFNYHGFRVFHLVICPCFSKQVFQLGLPAGAVNAVPRSPNVRNSAQLFGLALIGYRRKNFVCQPVGACQIQRPELLTGHRRPAIFNTACQASSSLRVLSRRKRPANNISPGQSTVLNQVR